VGRQRAGLFLQINAEPGEDSGVNMALYEEFQSQGNWLFRWRSYLPLPLILLAAMAMRQFHLPFGSLRLHEIWEESCLAVSFFGLIVRVVTIGFAPPRTSGRNTQSQIADQLNTSGIYSIVRHPLYLGNFLIGLGISLVIWVWWLPVIYTLAFCIYYERIMFAEEQFLRQKFGKVFEAWALATPAFWPRLAQWRRPNRSFSIRKVLRREYTGLLVVIASHSAIEFAEHWIWSKDYATETFWIFLFGTGTGAYLVLRTLKRRTHWLDVAG
jgi:protein-S-isoprenylcysteine O-methyltransferase Ste14